MPCKMTPESCRGVPLAVVLLSAALVQTCVGVVSDDMAQLEYGFHLPRANSYKIFTQMFESPIDKSCYSASDCTKKCVESCEMAAVDLKCASGHCRKTCRLSKECNGDVPKHPRGDNCRYICDQDCMMECRVSEEEGTRDKLHSCVQKKSHSCVEECVKSNGKTSQIGCENVCEVRARSECTAYIAQHCMGACGRHVCSQDGKCKCPFLLKGNSMCSTYSWLRSVTPEDTSYCFQSLYEEKFRTSKYGETKDTALVSLVFDHTRNSELALESNRRYVAAKSRELGHDHMATVPSPDLMDMGDFSSCAVIGSAGVLTGKGLGPAIDNHSAVIRFNDAPTRGYEADVGRKTTLRVQNNMYCGFCENPTEVLFPYTIGTVENFCYPRMNKPKCKTFKASNELRNFVSRFFEPLIERFAENSTWYDNMDKPQAPDVGLKRRLLNKPLVTQRVRGEEVSLKDMSAGLTGILVAMHMCHTVDVYGFGKSDTYYYPKVKRQDREWTSIHYWPLERKCLAAYDKYMAGVNFIH